MKIEDIEGIGKVYGHKLRDAAINTTESLLESGASRSGRNRLAKETGMDAKAILKFVNMADLFRIRGVSTQYSELLEAAGVDTVKELRNRNAQNLAAKMAEVQEAKKLTRKAPDEKTVQGWIDQAKALPPVLTY